MTNESGIEQPKRHLSVVPDLPDVELTAMSDHLSPDQQRLVRAAAQIHNNEPAVYGSSDLPKPKTYGQRLFEVVLEGITGRKQGAS